MKLEDFMLNMSDMTSIPINQMSVKVVEESMIRRIDKHIKN